MYMKQLKVGKCAQVNHRFGSVIGVGFNSWSVGIHPGSPNGYCASCLANASTLACVCQRASRPQCPSYGIYSLLIAAVVG